MPKQMPRKPSRPNRRDSERYRRFAEAYLHLSNPETYLKADRSAVKAGYSKSYAFHRAYELLGRVGVQKEIKRIRDARLKMSTIATPEEVLETLTQQMRTLPRDLVDPVTDNVIPLHAMSRDQSQAIAGVKIKEKVLMSASGGADGVPSAQVIDIKREYKLVDRTKAAVELGRYHGIFEKGNRQKPANGPNNILVAFPTTPMTLEEWQRQAIAIMASGPQAQHSSVLPESEPSDSDQDPLSMKPS